MNTITMRAGRPHCIVRQRLFERPGVVSKRWPTSFQLPNAILHLIKV